MVLNSPRYAALLAALAAFVADPPWVERVAKAATRHTLPELVGRACARVDRAARAAEGALDVGGPELHEVRKAAKRARYAAEVAGPLAGSPAHALAQRMPERQAFALGLLTGVERASDELALAAYGLALAAASTEEVRDWTRRDGGHPQLL